MRKTRDSLLLVGFVVCSLLAGCIHRGQISGKLYFEPPARLIEDYTGMVEVDELNWAWTKPGFRMSSYGNLTLKPMSNFTGIEDSTIPARIYEGLTAWCEQAGLKLSDDGQITFEGAIVALHTERSFLQKINPFREDGNDFLLEAEFIIKEMPTQNTLCKIRHGVTALQSDQLASLLVSGLARYFDAHK